MPAMQLPSCTVCLMLTFMVLLLTLYVCLLLTIIDKTMMHHLTQYHALSYRWRFDDPF
ncbi:small hydrophobic protein [Bat Paramyxovirus Epo_spe/AR1/DRC/2009]|uniref:Small hydrophobic protein n=1 Tax=Bat Paramyxovirus Epo_spe/AR1/DRC/2009 TaxID=1112597 RepID=I0E097_9MONO|nr:small hydrophobic protein [Bat Paramyxovirus Epo_spe/AR1/DRC/2009]AFH96015.1 small hydrophobic protein [Bat Paramyxovirus Epo_spe/AR1/DRC/2009]